MGFRKIYKPIIYLLCGFFGVAVIGCNPQSTSYQDGSVVSNPPQGLDYQPESTTWPASFGLGREASQSEVDSLSIAIPPDGKGLPEGEGTSLGGKTIYLQKCAACHGLTGKEGPQDVLVSTDSVFSEKKGANRAIGNYWPHATTVFDYIRRAMPSNAPGSLTDEEVYHLTAWLLHQNGIIAEDFPINAQSLPLIEMPAKNLFETDTRTAGPNPTY